MNKTYLSLGLCAAIAATSLGQEDEHSSLDLGGEVVTRLPVAKRPPPRGLPDDVPVEDPPQALSVPRQADPVVVPVTPQSAWKVELSIAARTGYDSNVLLQDVGALASRESMFTSIAPKLAASYLPAGAKTPLVALSYAPVLTWFHDVSSEDHVAHHLLADLNLSEGRWSVGMNHTLTWIDGEDEGLIFTAPGGAPALGGLAIRDRRDAVIYKSTIKAQYTADGWFVRPIVNAYVHDFQTRHLSTPGYQNFADRSDLSVGVDLGLKIAADSFVTLGYRAGWQTQADVLAVPTDYTNRYQRVLLGLEAKPAPWLTLNAALGPDFRTFTGDTPAGFDDEQVFLSANVSASVRPSDRDTITLLITRLVLPGFGGRSAFEDSVYSLTWKHVNGPLTISLGGRAHRGEFLDPVVRDDWVYTISPSVEYRFNAHATVEVGYACELGDSRIDNTPGREYERHVVYGAVKLSY